MRSLEKTCDNCKFSKKKPLDAPCAYCNSHSNWIFMYSKEPKTVEELEEICANNHYQKRDKIKIKINIFGYLRLFRNKTWKPQLCPFASSPEVNCGDWCPMFEEPEIRENTDVHLHLCQVTLVAEPDNFEDLR